jgi:hypothetical protein
VSRNYWILGTYLLLEKLCFLAVPILLFWSRIGTSDSGVQVLAMSGVVLSFIFFLMIALMLKEPLYRCVLQLSFKQTLPSAWLTLLTRFSLLGVGRKQSWLRILARVLAGANNKDQLNSLTSWQAELLSFVLIGFAKTMNKSGMSLEMREAFIQTLDAVSKSTRPSIIANRLAAKESSRLH